MSAAEHWRPCALNPNYEVSDAGAVRRLWTHHTRLLKPYPGRHDYLKVQLGQHGPRIYVHTLVALTFIGPRPLGHHVDHINFDRRDNSLPNLRFLPGPVNSVRWANRVNGHNVWELVSHLPCPDDYVTLSSEEADDIYAEFASVGW